MRSLISVFLFITLVAVVKGQSAPEYPDNCFFSVQKDSHNVWWIVDPNGQTFYIKGIDVIHPQGDTDRVTGQQPYWETVLKKYDPGFERIAKQIVRQSVLPYSNDPYFLGYFLDNEIYMGPDWHLNVPLFSYYVNFTTDSAGFQAAIAWAQSLYGTIDNVNKAWNLNLKTWTDFNNREMPFSQQYNNVDSQKFDRLTANHYFNVTCTAIRNVDVNHLILGIKYDGYPSEQVIMADAEYGSDVLSIDWYQWPEPSYGEITDLWNIGQKPILFGEFAYRGNDTGLPNTHGAGPVVPTQAVRAQMYTQFTQNMSMLPYTVGSLWFEWVDEPINGRGDGENSNYGVVNVEDDVYTDLTNAMFTTNPKLDLLHGSTRSMPAQCKPKYICPNGCSNNGCCDQGTGRCVCTSFFSGGDCSVPTGYYQESFNSGSSLVNNWALANNHWGSYYTYYRADYWAYSLSNDRGITLYLNGSDCPSQCGNSAYAGAGVEGLFQYAAGWLNVSAIGCTDQNAEIQVNWVNTDATTAVDGWRYFVNQTAVTVQVVYNSVYTTVAEIGLKFDSSEDFHTYSLFWGSNNKVVFAIDNDVVFAQTVATRYYTGVFQMYLLANDKLKENLTSASIKEVSYVTEQGWAPAHC